MNPTSPNRENESTPWESERRAMLAITAGVRHSLGAPEGAFLLIWGYATLLLAGVVFLLVRGGVAWGPSLYMLIPVLGTTGSVLLIRSRRGKRPVYGALGGSVRNLWVIVGPSIGFIALLVDNPLPAQAFLAACGVALQGGLLRWPIALVAGISIMAITPLQLLVPAPYEHLTFGALVALALCVPGHGVKRV